MKTAGERRKEKMGARERERERMRKGIMKRERERDKESAFVKKLSLLQCLEIVRAAKAWPVPGLQKVHFVLAEKKSFCDFFLLTWVEEIVAFFEG